MDKQDLKDIIKILVFMFLILGGLVISSCSGGWSIMGYELTPNDSSKVFVYLIDQDSTRHHFKKPVVLESDNWCYKHSIYEMVRAKNK
tara:strand:- start:14521 stop:14784 length:264 start_codon:yes stop_codon:yes gene_type:complete